MKLSLQYYPQTEKHSCGPVSLRMIFEHLGKTYSEEELIALCRAIPKLGTNHKNLIKGVKNEGFEYIEKNKGTVDEIMRFIDEGRPVIVNYYDTLSKSGHYAVVSGYDKKEKIIILADPKKGNDHTLYWDEFEKIWHNRNNSSKRWYLVIGRGKIII